MEAPHPVFGPGFQGGSDFEKIAVADEILHRMGGHEDLALGHADIEFGPEAEALGDDGQQAIRQLGGDAALDFGGESGDHPLQGFGAGRGMDGGDDQVAGFGSVKRQPHGLRVAHLADHQHIGVFAQGVDQGLLEARGVAPDLALADIGAARAEDVFDRAFDGDDVARIA